MMNMTQNSQTQMRPVADVALSSDEVHSSMTRAGNGMTALREDAKLPILAVTYWFDTEPHPTSYPVTIRFFGHRVDVEGQLSTADEFVKDETIEQVIAGSGPISVTTRIRNINAGAWAVTAHMHDPQTSIEGSSIEGHSISTARLGGPITRLWHQWAPSVGEVATVKTCLTPFAHIPGTLPGIWGAMVILGIVVALVLQSLIIARLHLAVSSPWVISLIAIMVGIIGAKGWFIVLYHRVIGWCIQGFITGSSLAAIVLLVVLHVPVGAFLDATAPGLLIAMAVGRVGCFLAGCCGGPPTASRWGVWSSDQRVGARRIPTQLLELGLAGILGLGVFVAILAHGARGGALFVGGLAVYTLLRQGILYLRAEPRTTKWWGWVTLTLAALALIVVGMLLAR